MMLTRRVILVFLTLEVQLVDLKRGLSVDERRGGRRQLEARKGTHALNLSELGFHFDAGRQSRYWAGLGASKFAHQHSHRR